MVNMVQNNETSKNYLCSYSQGQETFDWILLQMLAAVIFMTILVSNGLAMWRIFSFNKRKRATAMFILLCIADVIVALISIPLFYTALFNVNHSLPFFHNCHSLVFVMVVPVYFSWYVTVTITLDRFLLVKYPIRYRNFMRGKKILRTLSIWFPIYVTIMLLVYYEKELMGITIIGGIVQATSTLILFVGYGYIIMVTRRKININSQVRDRRNRRLTMTIFYIFLSQVVFALPATITIFLYVKSWGDLNMEKKMGYWSKIFLFSNSFANALVLLQSQNKIIKNDATKKRKHAIKLKLTSIVVNPKGIDQEKRTEKEDF